MRVLVCGSRDWTDSGEIAYHLALIFGAERVRVVIHGNARGADIIAGWCASGVGAGVEVYPADWARHGKGAGPRRNQRMLDEGKPDQGLVFGALWRPSAHPCGGAPVRTGTGDMANRMFRAGMPVRWVAAPDACHVDLTEMPAPPGGSDR